MFAVVFTYVTPSGPASKGVRCGSHAELTAVIAEHTDLCRPGTVVIEVTRL